MKHIAPSVCAFYAMFIQTLSRHHKLYTHNRMKSRPIKKLISHKRFTIAYSSCTHTHTRKLRLKIAAREHFTQPQLATGSNANTMRN